MTVTDRATDLITVREFYALVEDGQKADLIDGVTYLASPDTLKNDRLTGFLSWLIGGYAEARDLGEVFGSRFAFVLSPIRAPEPDIAFVGRQRMHLVHEHGMEGGPDVAVEVISTDSARRDRVEKKRLYEDAGVTEYWLIDPLKRRADFFRLAGRRYGLVELEAGHIFHSVALAGFFLDTEWLFATPPPKAGQKLREILASGKKRARNRAR